MKKFLALMLVLAMVFTLCACGAKEETPAEAPAETPAEAPTESAPATPQDEAKANPVTLKVAIGASVTAANGQAAKMWCDLVNDADVGIDMQLFPDSQLGGEDEILQQIVMGEPLITNCASDALEPYAPQLSLLNGPYFVEEMEDLKYVPETEWFKEQEEILKSQNLIIVNAEERFGQRNLLCTKEVRTPADLAGLKIRSQPSEVSMAMVNSMGATAIPLDFSEIYEGLSNGVIDGEENPLATIYNAKHHEATAKVISLTGHVSTIDLYTMNYAVYNTLTDYQKQVLGECAHEAFTYYNEVLYPEATAAALEAFKREGVTIVDDVDIAAFKEATKSVYDIIDPDGVYDEVMAQIAALKAADK